MGIVILRVESPLFFANADGVETVVRVASARAGVRAVVLDAETMAAIDMTAADMLGGLADRLDAATCVWSWLARWVRSATCSSVAEAGQRPLEVYPTVRAAVDAVTGGPS